MRQLRYFVVIAALALSAAPFVGCTEDLGVGTSSLESRVICTLTQGFWKNHEDAWPVTSLTLGSVTYDQAELLAILHEPVVGNGLVALAHQLIAAKLNVANGADGSSIAGAIADADALIGGLVVPPVGAGALKPSVTSSLVGQLDDYNSGRTGPGHCGDTPPPPPPPDAGVPVCGNGILESGEACDDGNTYDDDGCSSTCCIEPVCGNGILEGDEECDDGNTWVLDGCSSTCEIEPPPPHCGNGIVEGYEECDDGNTDDNDGCSSECTCECTPD